MNTTLKLFQVTRPSLRGTTMPVYYYTFAADEIEARAKIELKWGEYDSRTIVKELRDEEILSLVIATNFYG